MLRKNVGDFNIYVHNVHCLDYRCNFVHNYKYTRCVVLLHLKRLHLSMNVLKSDVVNDNCKFSYYCMFFFFVWLLRFTAINCTVHSMGQSSHLLLRTLSFQPCPGYFRWVRLTNNHPQLTIC